MHSCDENRVFEENIDFLNAEWTYENEITFQVSLTDQTPKNAFINFRHSYFFSKRNVILDLSVKNPKGEINKKSINIPLSEPNGMWYGDCSGDICTIQFPIKEYANHSFIDTGLYEFTISQDMRINPLPNVMAVGLRIENVVE